MNISPLMSPNWQRILVVPLRFVGDTVLAVPLIRTLRRVFPDACIEVLVSRVGYELLEPCPYIDRLILEPKGCWAQYQTFEAGKYNAVFSLRKSVTLALLLKLAHFATTVVGYDKQRWASPLGYKRWGIGLDRVALYPSRKTDISMALNHLGLLSACSLPIDGEQDSLLELWTTPEDEAVILTSPLVGEVGFASNEASRVRGKMAALHITSATPEKNISPQSFIPAIQALDQAGYTLLCSGTSADQEAYVQLAHSAGIALVNLAGKTTLRQLVALYRHVNLLLSIDSGPIHLAAAAGVPHIVGVYGPTNPRQWGPAPSVARPAGATFIPVFVDGEQTADNILTGVNQIILG